MAQAIHLVEENATYTIDVSGHAIELQLLTAPEKHWITLRLQQLAKKYPGDSLEEQRAFHNEYAEMLSRFVVSISGFEKVDIVRVLQRSNNPTLCFVIQKQLLYESTLSADDIKNSGSSSEQ